MRIQLIVLTLLVATSFSFVSAADGQQSKDNSQITNPPADPSSNKQKDVITAVGRARYRRRNKQTKKISPRMRLFTLRAAKMSCYRNMGEKLDQLYTADGKLIVDTFSDAKTYMKIKTHLVRGLQFIGKPKYTKEGAEVRGELTLSRIMKAFKIEKLYWKRK